MATEKINSLKKSSNEKYWYCKFLKRLLTNNIIEKCIAIMAILHITHIYNNQHVFLSTGKCVTLTMTSICRNACGVLFYGIT